MSTPDVYPKQSQRVHVEEDPVSRLIDMQGRQNEMVLVEVKRSADASEKSAVASERSAAALETLIERVPSVKVVTAAAYALITSVVVGLLIVIIVLIFGFLQKQGVDVTVTAAASKELIELLPAVSSEVPEKVIERTIEKTTETETETVSESVVQPPPQ